MTATKKPTLPSLPKNIPKDLQGFLKSIKEIMEVGEGNRGNELDKYLTYRNLVDAGLATLLRNGTLIASLDVTNPTVITSDPNYDPTPPPAPTDLTVVGGYSFIHLTWAGQNSANIGSTEVWRSATNDLGTAVFIGATSSTFYVDEAGTSSQLYFYWVRFKSIWGTITSPIYGPFNGVSGTSGQTALDVEFVLEQLEGQVNRTQLSAILNQELDDLGTGQVQVSQDVSDLNASWSVKAQVPVGQGQSKMASFGIAVEYDPDSDTSISAIIGKADLIAFGSPGADEFAFTIGTVNGIQTVGIGSAHILDLAVKNAAVQSLAADKIFAPFANIAQILIGSGHIQDLMIGNVIQSGNVDGNGNVIPGTEYVPGVRGWHLNKASGFFECQNIFARGNIEATSIKADSANIISTLMLQNQAVVFPLSIYEPAESSVLKLLTNESWSDVIAINFPSTGAPVHVSGMSRMRLEFDYVQSGNGSRASVGLFYRVIKNDGVETEILRQCYLDLASYIDDENGSGQFNTQWLNAVYSFSDTPGNITVAYKVQARIVVFEATGGFGSLNGQMKISFIDKGITCLETKK